MGIFRPASLPADLQQSGQGLEIWVDPKLRDRNGVVAWLVEEGAAISTDYESPSTRHLILAPSSLHIFDRFCHVKWLPERLRAIRTGSKEAWREKIMLKADWVELCRREGRYLGEVDMWGGMRAGGPPITTRSAVRPLRPKLYDGSPLTPDDLILHVNPPSPPRGPAVVPSAVDAPESTAPTVSPPHSTEAVVQVASGLDEDEDMDMDIDDNDETPVDVYAPVTTAPDIAMSPGVQPSEAQAATSTPASVIATTAIPSTAAFTTTTTRAQTPPGSPGTQTSPKTPYSPYESPEPIEDYEGRVQDQAPNTGSTDRTDVTETQSEPGRLDSVPLASAGVVNAEAGPSRPRPPAWSNGTRRQGSSRDERGDVIIPPFPLSLPSAELSSAPRYPPDQGPDAWTTSWRRPWVPLQQGPAAPPNAPKGPRRLAQHPLPQPAQTSATRAVSSSAPNQARADQSARLTAVYGRTTRVFRNCMILLPKGKESRKKFAQLIMNGSGQHQDQFVPSSSKVRNTTHIMCDDSDVTIQHYTDEEWDVIIRSNLPIVNFDWLIHSAEAGRLLPTDQYPPIVIRSNERAHGALTPSSHVLNSADVREPPPNSPATTSAAQAGATASGGKHGRPWRAELRAMYETAQDGHVPMEHPLVANYPELTLKEWQQIWKKFKIWDADYLAGLGPKLANRPPTAGGTQSAASGPRRTADGVPSLTQQTSARGTATNDPGVASGSGNASSAAPSAASAVQTLGDGKLKQIPPQLLSEVFDAIPLDGTPDYAAIFAQYPEYPRHRWYNAWARRKKGGLPADEAVSTSLPGANHETYADDIAADDIDKAPARDEGAGTQTKKTFYIPRGLLRETFGAVGPDAEPDFGALARQYPQYYRTAWYDKWGQYKNREPPFHNVPSTTRTDIALVAPSAAIVVDEPTQAVDVAAADTSFAVDDHDIEENADSSEDEAAKTGSPRKRHGTDPPNKRTKARAMSPAEVQQLIRVFGAVPEGGRPDYSSLSRKYPAYSPSSWSALWSKYKYRQGHFKDVPRGLTNCLAGSAGDSRDEESEDDGDDPLVGDAISSVERKYTKQPTISDEEILRIFNVRYADDKEAGKSAFVIAKELHEQGQKIWPALMQQHPAYSWGTWGNLYSEWKRGAGRFAGYPPRAAYVPSGDRQVLPAANTRGEATTVVATHTGSVHPSDGNDLAAAHKLKPRGLSPSISQQRILEIFNERYPRDQADGISMDKAGPMLAIEYPQYTIGTWRNFYSEWKRGVGRFEGYGPFAKAPQTPAIPTASVSSRSCLAQTAPLQVRMPADEREEPASAPIASASQKASATPLRNAMTPKEISVKRAQLFKSMEDAIRRNIRGAANMLAKEPEKYQEYGGYDATTWLRNMTTWTNGSAQYASLPEELRYQARAAPSAGLLLSTATTATELPANTSAIRGPDRLTPAPHRPSPSPAPSQRSQLVVELPRHSPRPRTRPPASRDSRPSATPGSSSLRNSTSPVKGLSRFGETPAALTSPNLALETKLLASPKPDLSASGSGSTGLSSKRSAPSDISHSQPRKKQTKNSYTEREEAEMAIYISSRLPTPTEARLADWLPFTQTHTARTPAAWVEHYRQYRARIDDIVRKNGGVIPGKRTPGRKRSGGGMSDDSDVEFIQAASALDARAGQTKREEIIVVDSDDEL